MEAANNKKLDVLNLLKQSNDYVSGEEISRHLNVSRTFVWKLIQQLTEDGYTFAKSTKKGYKLVNIPDILTPGEIQDGLKTKWLGRCIYYYPTIDSTSNEAKRKIVDSLVENGTLFISEQQTAGRGRMGRKWVSPPGVGIWMTLVLTTKILPVNIFKSTLITGLAVCKAIQEVTCLDAKVKWPNDIVVDNKKVCGILCELTGDAEEINYIIIGIGINVNTTEFPEEIGSMATSVKLQMNESILRKNIVQEVLNNLEAYFERFLADCSLESFMEDYKSNCITLGREVKLIKNGVETVGEAIDINENGELVVKDNTGNNILINTGEVSVRGLFDYI